MEGPQDPIPEKIVESESDLRRVLPPTRKDWQDVMRSNARFKMHEIIERLGLRANWSSNKRGRTNFDSPLVKELVTDMSSVIASLPKENAELISYLSADGHEGEGESALEKEVEELVQKHGAAIWGRVGERDHLVSAGGGEGGYYPRDLYFEEAEDRKLIRILLHWWLGMKACNAIVARVRMARERKKREETKKARAEGESPQDIAPAMSGDGLARPEHSATPDLDPGPSKQSLPPALTVQQACAGLGDFAANFMVDGADPYRSVANGTTRGLDGETLQAFRAYIYAGENEQTPDEEALLRRLELAWRDRVRSGVRSSSRENPTLFAAMDGAFLTWVELRRHLAELLRVEKRWSEAEDARHDVEGRIAQYRGLTRATRELVSSWEGIAGGSATADDLLVQAFMLLAGEGSNAMSWAPVNAAHMIRQLAETLQQDRDEEEQEAGRLMYVT